MLNVKLALGFSRYSDNDLEALCTSIISMMTGNKNFPSPVPTLVEIEKAHAEYKQALADARTRTVGKALIKDNKRQMVEKLLSKLGTWVELNCDDDPTIAVTSGFALQKYKTPIGVLDKPNMFEVEVLSNPGMVEMFVEKIYGAHSYSFEHTEGAVTPASVWVAKPSTATTCVVTGLKSGVMYSFRVAGVGADPTLMYSDIISRYVQ